MYRDPFNPGNGTAAAAVWGQPSLDAGVTAFWGCEGSDALDSLCAPDAVDIDAAGNMWVADFGNFRILRFPRNPASGAIAPTADMSLGLDSYPSAVRVDPQGDVYVTSAHIIRFTNPQPNASNIPQTLSFIESDPYYAHPWQIAFDPTAPGRLWAQIRWDTAVLIDLTTQQVLKRVRSGDSFALDVSQAGDLFWTETADSVLGQYSSAGLYRLGANEAAPASGIAPEAFAGQGVPTEGNYGILGITTAGNQLLVSDRYAVYFWNDYHTITQGSTTAHPADGLWGLGDLASSDSGQGYFVRSDTRGRIWINSTITGLKIFQGPLTETSTPLTTLSVSMTKARNGSIIPLPSGVAITPRDFLPIGAGDRAWLVDDAHSRVVRVVNIDGVEAPGQPPYVDVVLGQARWSGTHCNRGRGTSGRSLKFARGTFCREGFLGLDAQNNLFLQDNADSGIDGGFTRILRWNAGTIPDHPSRTRFNIPADSVYGNGGPKHFRVAKAYGNPYFPFDPTETVHTPRAPTFAAGGIMVLGGADPYDGPRFPLVYLNKDKVFQPQLTLGDMMSFPMASYVDPDGNLYLGDFDWQRVLVYKTPFAQFAH